MIRLLSIAALVVAALPSAHGATSADATLSDFRITLADLDPGDGIAPSITLDPSAQSHVRVGTQGTGGIGTTWGDAGAKTFGAVSISGELDGVGGSASLAGDPLGAGATLAAHAHGVTGVNGGFSEALGDYEDAALSAFVLSPHTQVTFSGLASTAWNTDDPYIATYAGVQIMFRRIDHGVVAWSLYDDFAQGWMAGFSTTPSGTASRVVQLSYANNSDDALTLHYNVEATVLAGGFEALPTPPPSAVDEPAGAALLLVGIVPAWLALRRRGRAGAAASPWKKGPRPGGPCVAATARISGGSGACRSAPSRCRVRRRR